MCRFEIDLAWNTATAKYTDKDIEPLGEWNNSGLLTDPDTGKRLRDVQLLLHTPEQVRNAVSCLEGLDPPLEYMCLHWDPPDWVVSLQEWGDTHGLAIIRTWFDNLGEWLVERIWL